MEIFTRCSSRLSRRQFLGSALATGAAAFAPRRARAEMGEIPPDLRTPYKFNRLVVAASHQPGAFDSESVDAPFVFRHGRRFYMTYIGFDGQGYQTGLASSRDLVTWNKEGLILPRDPQNPVTRYNVALTWILRENNVFSSGKLKKVNGRYLGTYHAYPQPGYEEGPAVIGLASSADLHHWDVQPPCLFPQDGAPWSTPGSTRPACSRRAGTIICFITPRTSPTIGASRAALPRRRI